MNLSETVGILYICLVIVERSSLLCVLSVFTHVHTQKCTQMLYFTAVSICLFSAFFPQAFNSLTFYLLFSVFSSISLFLPFCPIIHLSPVFFFFLPIPLYFYPFPSFSFQRAQSHGVQSTSQDGNPKSRESHRLYVTLS